MNRLALFLVAVAVPASQPRTVAGQAIPGFARREAMARGDTVVAVRRGDRVVLRNLSGDITVGTWDRDEVEVRGEEDAAVLVRRSGSTIEVTRDDRKGRHHSVEATIRVPDWVDFVAGGQSLDLTVDGIQGDVTVSNVDGDVWVRNTGGTVEVQTVEGEVDVSNARGSVSASSQSDDVTLRDVTGDVAVHSGSGDVKMIDIRSSSVRAETQDGDIDFSGVIEDDGDYAFFVHDGDATIAIPEDSNARVAVSTFDGEFQSEFPVRLERFTGGREFDFTIGEARARIQIQVFDGEIEILRRR